MFLENKLRFGGLLMAAGFLTAVASVLGFYGAWWWVFDLFAHFRVQYFTGLTVLGLILLSTTGESFD